jgi:hypothetical protein
MEIDPVAGDGPTAVALQLFPASIDRKTFPVLVAT